MACLDIRYLGVQASTAASRRQVCWPSLLCFMLLSLFDLPSLFVLHTDNSQLRLTLQQAHGVSQRLIRIRSWSAMPPKLRKRKASATGRYDLTLRFSKKTYVSQESDATQEAAPPKASRRARKTASQPSRREKEQNVVNEGNFIARLVSTWFYSMCASR